MCDRFIRSLPLPPFHLPGDRMSHMSLRDRYVHGARAARSVAERSGTLSWADSRRERKPRGAVAHARTLLAIHDVDDLVELELPWWTYRAIDVVDAFLCGLHGQA